MRIWINFGDVGKLWLGILMHELLQNIINLQVLRILLLRLRLISKLLWTKLARGLLHRLLLEPHCLIIWNERFCLHLKIHVRRESLM